MTKDGLVNNNNNNDHLQWISSISSHLGDPSISSHGYRRPWIVNKIYIRTHKCYFGHFSLLTLSGKKFPQMLSCCPGVRGNRRRSRLLLTCTLIAEKPTYEASATTCRHGRYRAVFGHNLVLALPVLPQTRLYRNLFSFDHTAE